MGGVPATNVQALKRRGVDARLVLFKPPRLRSEPPDMVLNLPDGAGPARLLHRQALQWRAFARLLPQVDIFHFYFGVTLVPKTFQFPILRATGKKSIFHFLGADIREVASMRELEYGRLADVRIVGSYDALRFVPFECEVVVPGIEVRSYTPVPPSRRKRPLVVHAPSNREKKGTEDIVAACEELPVDLDVVEDVRHDEALERYARADIVVDQLIRGWHGVFTIESMALAKPVVTSLYGPSVKRTEDAFGLKVPIVAATKENLVEKLRPLVESPAERRRIGAESRAYVEQVHDLDRVIDQLLAIYERL